MSVALAAAPIRAQLPPRVEMDEVLRQVITRIDPVTPPAAAAAQIGGLVIAEIIIRVNGTVESARIIAGEAALHQAAIDAVSKWTFKPFLRNGKPARVTALIDLRFPDPKADEALRGVREMQAARGECEQQVRERSSRAVVACAEAVRLAETHDRGNPLGRSRMRQQYAVALVQAGRTAEALPELEQALQIWIGDAGENDADAADQIAIIAVVHQRLGDHAKADQAFTRAERAFQGAIDRARQAPSDYFERFGRVLGLHAALKRQIGQEDAARALETRAAGIVASGPPPRTESMRVVAGVMCLCPDAPHFDEAEVSAQIKVIPATARAWFVVAEGGMAAGKSSASVFGVAEASGAGYRAGSIGTVTWGRPVPPPVKDRWAFNRFDEMWIQLTDDGAGARMPSSRRDPDWPITVMWALKNGTYSVADTVALARFVRDEGRKTGAAGRPVPNLSREIQPWPIESMGPMGSGTVMVMLGDPNRRHRQRITLRKTPSGWAVVSIAGSLNDGNDGNERPTCSRRSCHSLPSTLLGTPWASSKGVVPASELELTPQVLVRHLVVELHL